LKKGLSGEGEGEENKWIQWFLFEIKSRLC